MLRISAIAMMVGALGWLAAGVVLTAWPSEAMIDRVHRTLIPAGMVALLVGSVGLKAWLGDFRPRAHRRVGRGGLASGLEAMSSKRHHVVGGAASGGDDEDTVTARGLGVAALWLGAAGVIVSSQLVTSSPAMSSTLLFSWICFLAGTMVLGLAVITAAELPRRAGWLLAIGSLPVFSSMGSFLAGGARKGEIVSPLLGADGDLFVLELVLWSMLGAAWGWLGGALWLRTTRPDAVAGSGPSTGPGPGG